MDFSGIEAIGASHRYYYSLDGNVEWITPVKLSSGGWSFYIQNFEMNDDVWPYEAGIYETEGQAVLAGFAHLKKYEQDCKGSLSEFEVEKLRLIQVEKRW